MTPSAHGLRARLRAAEAEDRLPAIRAYHRIDGPGSSLDLKEFQQALWRWPESLAGSTTLPGPEGDPALPWSRYLARTVALTIDTGTVITAHPYDDDAIAVQSIEYETEVSGRPGEIGAMKENWLLKIVESFGLVGLKFVLQNLVEGTHSAGLGGSATATTGTAMLANALAGYPLGPIQLVAMASRMETDYEVSLTGTQEQSNVVFGGVVDYLWCPWGVPGQPSSGYGSSVRSTLLGEEAYPDLEARMAIFHSGRERASSNTNSAWVRALAEPAQYDSIRQKLEAAYAYREGLRHKDWGAVTSAIRSYRQARTDLCDDYMTGARELHDWAESAGGAVFPLGAGGGGGVLVFHERPEGLVELRDTIGEAYREVPFKLRSTGHELLNVDLG